MPRCLLSTLSLRTVEKATPFEYVCVPVCTIRVYVHTHACLCTPYLDFNFCWLFMFPSYPPIWPSCATIIYPPSTDEQICLLLTTRRQSCHSRTTTLWGCAALGCHFPGCHSLGKHLLFYVAVTRQGHACIRILLVPLLPPAIHKLRCLSAIHRVCRTAENC